MIRLEQDHWFDGFCKQLIAPRDVSRRGIMQLMVGGVAGAGSVMIDKVTALAQDVATPPPNTGQANVGECVRRIVSGNLVAEVSRTKADVTLRYQQTYLPLTQTVTTLINISEGQSLILEAESKTLKGGRHYQPQVRPSAHWRSQRRDNEPGR
jgi:hypothetical protein